MLKTRSVLHLADEAFELMDKTLGRVHDRAVDEDIDTEESIPEEIVDEIRELRSIILEKRRLITANKLEEKAEDLWDDIEDRFEKILGRIKKE